MSQPMVIISNPKCAVKEIKKDGWGGDWKIVVCNVEKTHEQFTMHYSGSGTMQKGSGSCGNHKFDYTINPSH